MLEKIYRSNSAHPNGILSIAGENFDAYKTYFVRYGIQAGETIGRIYKATKLDPYKNSFFVIGCVQTYKSISAGDAILVLESGEINLLQNDANLSNEADGYPIFLGIDGAFTTDTPEVGLSPGTHHQAVLLGAVKIVGATSKDTFIKITPIVNSGEHIA